MAGHSRTAWASHEHSKGASGEPCGLQVGDEETKPLTALPAVRTTVLSPVLIAYHSVGGGVGKSTGSTQMGFAFAEMGYKTLIIELDTEKPSLLRAVGAAEDCPGLAAWNHSDFKNEATALEALRRTSRQIHELYVLPVGPISPKKVVLPFHLEGLEGGEKIGFCQNVLQDLEVPINTSQAKKLSLKNWLFSWRKKP